MGKNKKRKQDYGTKEIVFDPEARKNYLQGFSERKRQRRAYGLAMQKVKDRKARLDQRKEMKKAVEEQIEEAEQQKEDLLSGLLEEIGSKKIKKTAKKEEPAEVEQVQTYQDTDTQNHWGGSVIVTTTTVFPKDDESDNEEPAKPQKKGRIDQEQQYAGDVQRFMTELKGKLPGKKKKERRLKHRGSHGASNMKGMAGSGDMKIVQKALARSEAKKGRAGGKGGKKRKGR